MTKGEWLVFGAAGRISRRWLLSTLGVTALFVGLVGGGASAAVSATALQLNGSTQYVTFGAAPSLDAAQFTLEVWFKRTGPGVGTSTGSGGIASAVPLITKGRSEADGSNVDMNYFLGIDATSGKLVADFEEGPGGTGPLGLNHPITGTTVVSSNVWHHAAATYDGTWKLYLDGTLDGSLVVNQPPRSDSIQHAGLGTAMSSTGVAAGFFQGVIDEARIWNVARTPAQIQTAKDAELTSATGLVGRWGLNEGAGSTIGDSTSNLDIGTAVGAPTWSSDVPGLAAPAAWNAALYMNGGSSYMTLGAAPSLDAAQFTLETWFKRTGAGVGTSTGSGGLSNAIPLVTKGRSEADGTNVDMNYFLGIDATSGKLVADFEEGATGASPGLNHPVTGNTVVTSNVWHHAAATYDGTTWKLYLDGVADGSLAVGRPPRSDSIQHAALGTAMSSTGAPAGFFQGALDEARIWNYARTQAQIQATKNSAITSAAGLLGRWALDDGGGTTAAASAGAVNGTVVNAGWVAGAPLLASDTTPPAQPQGLNALPGDGSVSLSWTPNSESDLAGYNLYRATTSPVPTTSAPVNGSNLLTSPAYVDNGLGDGTTYHYVVVAVDNEGNVSSASAEAAATPAPSGPRALEFNGASQYVTLGPAAQLGAATFTLETWFKRTGAGVGTSTGSGGIADAIPLVTKGRAEADGSNVDMNYFLGIDTTSGTLVADFEDSATGANHPIFGQTAVTQNVWHHAAATFDGSYWRLYLDGALDAKLRADATPRYDSIQHAALATAMTSTGVAAGFFAGQLDEARIWNVARSGDQIRAARDDEITAASGLVGRFGMNEGTGATVGNSAGLPNGTAVNSPTWVAGYGFPQDTTAPGAPHGLTAAPDDQSATLTWTPGTEADLAGYDLYRSTSTPVDTSGTPVNGTDLIRGSSYNDAGLSNGTTYNYALVAVDGSNNRSVASNEATATPIVGDPVLIGAGDIASCTSSGDEATADLVDSAPNAGVYTLGDNEYENGLASEFANCYTPSWGRPGIKGRTRPTVGNHDYGNGTNTGDGYFDYFNGAGNFTGAAGDRDKGYYSYEVGPYWHVVVLNSECYFFTSECSASAEEQWLRADLDRNVSKNVIAMWHRPRWSSGASRGSAALQPLWQILYDYGVDLSLAGHDHDYERFAPQDANGALDNAHGIREIIVGTGGAEFTSVGTAVANSEVRNGNTWGVLKLRLHQSSYDWQFLPVAGGTFTDSGTGTTHGPPPAAPVIDSVVIDQATPKTADTLSASVVSHDMNGDPVTYAYQWQRNGVDIAGAAEATLDLATPGNGDKGDPISVRVTASDGALASAPVTSAAVTVVNSPPAATVALDPASPGTNQTLTATAAPSDADGDTITLTYVWKVDGITKRTQQTTAPTDTFDLSQPGNGDGGDTISVEVTPTDGTDAGSTATASVAVDGTAPSTPTGLTTTLTSTNVKLDWARNTESDFAGYRVYRASAVDGPYVAIGPPLPTVSEYVDASAPPATTSYYRVTALDTSGNESPPAAITVVRKISFRAASTAQNGGANTITIAKPAGVQPGDVLVAAIGVLNAPAITLPSGWTQIRSTDSGTALRQAASYHVVGTSEPASYTWTLASAQGAAGTIAAYAGVDATTPVDSSNGQANSSSASITAPSLSPSVTDTLLVGVFGLPVASSISPPASMLEQGESGFASGNTRVEVELADELRPGAGPTGTRVATASQGAANIGQLVALRPVGAPPPLTVPDAPIGLTASPGSNVVHLTWAAPTNTGGSAITAYHVYRGTTAGGEVSLITAGTATTTYDDATALNGTTYYYKVAAVNSIGEGAQSSEASATPSNGATVPTVPRNLSATAAKGKGITLSWQPPTSNGGSAVTGYRVYRGTAPGKEASTPIATVTGTTFKDTAGTRNTTYYYIVKAVNAVGESPPSNEANATAN